MKMEERIDALSKLGDFILENPVSLQDTVHKTYLYNNWFTALNTQKALQSIATEFLNKRKLEGWLSQYVLQNTQCNKTIAIVAAGNIPMVAFHDILCVLISGNKVQIKLSEKDKFLLPFLLQQLMEVEPRFKDSIEFTERMGNFDAIIATGSNNTAKHFEYYFGKYKNIIRRNRNSIAVLSGDESEGELTNLGSDIFDYFGLGCRNVSKVFVPSTYDLNILKPAWTIWEDILMNHNSYRNNLDYQRTLYLMNQTPLFDIDFVNIVENKSLYSPISCLHVERYESLNVVHDFIQQEAQNIQCIVGNAAIENSIPFGKSQQPGLPDYADNVDTLKFILEL